VRHATDVGNIAALGLIAVAAALVLWRRGLPLLLALAPGSALVFGGGLAAIGKSVVARARPPVSLHLVAESDASFPSGHATDSTALFVTLALIVAVFILRRPLTRLVCVLGSGLVAGGIGASRLILGVHWPSDVLAGWALGATAALAVTLTAVVLVRLVPPGPVVPNPRLRERVVYLLARERGSESLRAV
jgi:undecaprenyl-diphosphatase